MHSSIENALLKVGIGDEHIKALDWVRSVRLHRNAFKSAIFKIVDGEDVSYWSLSHALEKPLWALFAKLDIQYYGSNIITAQD